MSAKNHTQTQDAIGRWALVVIGAMMLYFAVFTDPVGDSPSMGLVIGTPATRILLGLFGGLFLGGGVYSFFKKTSG